MAIINKRSIQLKYKSNVGDVALYPYTDSRLVFHNGMKLHDIVEYVASNAYTKEYVFKRSAEKPSIPLSEGMGTVNGVPTQYNDDIDEWVPNGWSQYQRGVNVDDHNEWAVFRVKAKGTSTWSDFMGITSGGSNDEPILYSHFGEKGTDGKGIEYVYVRTKDDVAPAVYGDDTEYEDSNGLMYDSDEHLPEVYVSSEYDIDGSNTMRSDSISNGNGNAHVVQCTDEPQGVNKTWQYEWVLPRDNSNINSSGHRTWNAYSGSMSLWGKYSKDGNTPEYLYHWDPSANSAPSFNENDPFCTTNISEKGWSKTINNRPTGQYLWSIVSYKVSDGNYGPWGNPIRLTGDQGTPGEDGNDLEWIYIRFDEYPFSETDGVLPSTINTGEVSPNGKAGSGNTDKNVNDWVPQNWYDMALEVKPDEKYVYASWRKKESGVGATWGAFSAPILWSNWGERGVDGDGIEYVFIRTTKNVSPTINNDNYTDSSGRTYIADDFLPHVNVSTYIDASNSGSNLKLYECSDDPKGTDSKWKYEWVAKRKNTLQADGKTRKWEPYDGSMSLWANYSEDGQTPSYRYKWDSSAYTAPAYNTQQPNGIQPGWSINIPEKTDTYLWAISAYMSSDGEYGVWGNPVRLTGEQGTPGEDGNDLEWIYKRLNVYPFPNTETLPANISNGQVSPGPNQAANGNIDNKNQNDWVPNTWYDTARPVTEQEKFVYASWRKKAAGIDSSWGNFSEPILWSNWGERGIDGDGIEYVFVRTQENVVPFTYEYDEQYIDSSDSSYVIDEHRPRVAVLSAYHISGHTTSGILGDYNVTEATDDPVGVDNTWRYEWVLRRNMNAPVNGKREWKAYSGNLSLWAKWANDGQSLAYRYKWDGNATVCPGFNASGGSNPGSGWEENITARTNDGDYLWQISAYYNNAGTYSTWGNPIRLTGDRGTPGEDSDDLEWIYNRFDSSVFPTSETKPADISTGQVAPHGQSNGGNSNKNQEDWVPFGWYDTALSVTEYERFVYASYRKVDKSTADTSFGPFSEPIVWNNWGERGIDGDGVEYVYVRTKKDVTPNVYLDDSSYIDSSGNDYKVDEHRPRVRVPLTDQISGYGTSTTYVNNRIVECTDDPVGVDDTWRYEWALSRRMTSPVKGKREWTPYEGNMSLWAKYSEDGYTPTYRYQWGTSDSLCPTFTENASNPGDLWKVNIENRPVSDTSTYYLWSISAMKNISGSIVTNWGNPVRMTGDTGTPGEDGNDLEWIYKNYNAPISESGDPLPADISLGEKSPNGMAAGNLDNKNQDDWVPNGWYDTALDVSSGMRYVYASYRKKPAGIDSAWGAFSTPILWSNWGERGIDGDGVEYVYVRTKDLITPSAYGNDSSYADSSGNNYKADEHRPRVRVPLFREISGHGDVSTYMNNKIVECTDDPVGVDETWRYEWSLTRKMSSPVNGKREWNPYSGNMALWAKYSEDGYTPTYRYQWYDSDSSCPAYTENASNPGDLWKVNIENRPTSDSSTYYLWSISAMKDISGTITTNWGNPIRMTGDTGTPGEDGKDLEWIYKTYNIPILESGDLLPADISMGQRTPSGMASGYNTNKNQDDWVPNGWYDTALSVSSDAKYVYASYRIKPTGIDSAWGAFSEPILWSNWGERGIDGDGVEYVYVRTKNMVVPSVYGNDSIYFDSSDASYTTDEHRPRVSVDKAYSISGYINSVVAGSDKYTECTDDPVGVNEMWQYEWVLSRTKGAPVNGKRTWKSYTGEMSLWAKFAKDAANVNPNILLGTNFGRGIDLIKNKWVLDGYDNANWTGNIGIDATETCQGRSSMRIDGSALVSPKYTGIKQDVYSRIENDQFYTLSFWGKLSTLYIYLYADSETYAAINRTVPFIVDGAEKTGTMPLNGAVTFTDNNGEWNYHTITFKTASTSQTNKFQVIFRSNYGKTNYICMPKLELGKQATAYIADESDLIGVKGADGSRGPDGSRGDDAEYYYLTAIPSNIIRFTDGTYNTASTTITAYKKVGTGNPQVCTGGFTIYADQYHDSSVLSSNTSTNGVLTISSFDSTADRIEISLKRNNLVYAVLTIPIYTETKGDTGPMYYPAGQYPVDGSTYVRTNDLCPIVEKDTVYYYLKVPTNYINSTNVAPPNANVWGVVSDYDVIFTKALFADFAKLGSFVVSKDFFISQYGTLKSSADEKSIGSSNDSSLWYVNSTDNKIYSGSGVIAYTQFDSNDPQATGTISSGTMKFVPALYINSKTGEFYGSNVRLKGTIEADSGYFGSMKISNDCIVAGDKETYQGGIKFGDTNRGYTRLSTNPTSLQSSGNIVLTNLTGGCCIDAYAIPDVKSPNAVAIKAFGGVDASQNGTYALKTTGKVSMDGSVNIKGRTKITGGLEALNLGKVEYLTGDATISSETTVAVWTTYQGRAYRLYLPKLPENGLSRIIAILFLPEQSLSDTNWLRASPGDTIQGCDSDGDIPTHQNMMVLIGIGTTWYVLINSSHSWGSDPVNYWI